MNDPVCSLKGQPFFGCWTSTERTHWLD